MGHIFISYSHKDKEYVHKLADVLQPEGFEVWIDDRIDYGTRWPLVIETAIDSCDAFILVASDNSHTSEWVQHEFVRAQRLQKQIYPVLIRGDPWISFESTQYFDARYDLLPNEKFYTTLRSNLNLYLENVKEMIVGSWPIYFNKKYGFSVNYPLDGKISNENNNFVRINLPVLHGTNLSDKYITIHFAKGNVISSPLAHESLLLDSCNVEILGHRFLRERGFDVAASKITEWASYTTSRGNKTIILSLILRTTSYEKYFPNLLPRIDLNAENETLLYVLSTFIWLDQA